MIIDLFGDIPRSQEVTDVLLSKIKTIAIAETLHKADRLKECANVLRTDCEEFGFCLDESFSSAEDVTLNLKHYLIDRRQTWKAFFDSMFLYRPKSKSIMPKYNTIFQIIHYLVHNGKKKTLLHLSLCESIYDTCRSKELITIMNRLGLCMSYDEIERIDIGLATLSIESAGEKSVLVHENIENLCQMLQMSNLM